MHARLGVVFGALPRRLVTIPGVFLLALLFWAALPVLSLLALLGDLARGKPSALLRSSVFFAWVLACEIVGLILAGGLWLARLLARVDGDRYVGWNYALQHRWIEALFGGMRRIYRLRFEVDGGELLARGGYLLLARHGSGMDYALPIVLAGAPYGRRIRYVLKAAMRWDPCLDVVGGRIPTAFVQPGQRDRAAQERELTALTVALGDDDAINVYPEGSRYSPRARDRQLARLDESGDRVAHARAQSLQRTLLPRSGAVKAILAAVPNLDVVLLAHHGLDRANGPGDLARGALLDARVRVRIWRIPAAEVALDDLDAWLFEQWAQIDAWVMDQERAP